MAEDIQNIANLLQATLDPRQNREGTFKEALLNPSELLSYELQFNSGACSPTGRDEEWILSAPPANCCN